MQYALNYFYKTVSVLGIQRPQYSQNVVYYYQSLDNFFSDKLIKHFKALISSKRAEF